jgi:hypothetical protein
MQKNPSRRNFLKQASFLGAAAFIAPASLQDFPPALEDSSGTGFTFLFRGDSITDGNRTRDMDWNHLLGHGYVYLIASRLWFDLPRKQSHFLTGE